MSRVKRGVTSHAKHKKTYKAAKGFYGRRKNTIRTAKAAVDRAMQYATRDRRAKKRFKHEMADNVQLSALERAGRLPLPDAQPDAEELAAAVQNIAFNGRQAAVKTTDEDEVPAYNAEVIELLGRKSRKAA
jgi:hypothetical protein